jgi:hypothetical protein
MISPRFHPDRTARLGILALLLAACTAAQSSGLTEALGLMERERTLGEANAGLLKTFASDDAATLARGIQLYAQAQADFNALIATLKAELIAEGELDEGQDFPADVQRAARQRVAFTDYVEEKVLSQTEEGTRSLGAVLGGADAISGVAELIEVLGGIGLDIWREYRAADQEQRRQILEQLDALKWRSFGEVPALG